MKRVFQVIFALLIMLAIALLFIFSDSLYEYYQGGGKVGSVTKSTSHNAGNKHQYLLSDTSKQIIISTQKPSVINGFDWRLPKNTKEVSNSGLISDDHKNNLKNKFILLRWDKTNPSKGRYDFSSFRNELKAIYPKKVLVRLEVNSACEAPKWALKQMRSTKTKSLVFWDPEYINLLRPYINAFAKQFANHSQVIGVQLGIADGEYNGSCEDYDNKDGWGEFWMSPKELADAENNYGLTPTLFKQRTEEIIDLYIAAFKSNKGKLAMTSIDSAFTWGKGSETYNKLASEIGIYAINKGIGNRDGEIEVWLRYLAEVYGMFFVKSGDNTCSLEMDEGFAKKIENRYWGTENEFYGKSSYILNYGGPYKNQGHRFMMSSLRALQMRRNYMTISSGAMEGVDDPIYKTRDFLDYLEKTLGKSIENTTDAFILLGERYIDGGRIKSVYSKSGEACIVDNKVKLRSFGRWLTEKSNSKPAVKIVMKKEEKFWAQDYYLPKGYDYEYLARSGKRFDFNINNKLLRRHCSQKCRVEIKVTYKDLTKTQLHIKALEGITHQYQTSGDGKIKTVTFNVLSTLVEKQGSNFILHANNSPVAVIMVRVNFLD